MSRTTVLSLIAILAVLVAWWATLDGSAGVRADTGGEWKVLSRGSESGSLEGKVLVDPEVPASFLSVRLELTVPAAGGVEWSLERALEQDGSFFFHPPSLPPGHGTLFVDVARGVPLARIDGIVVPDSGPSLDPRLRKIDLRGQVHAFRFEVFDQEGEPVRAALGWRPADPEGRERPYERWVEGAGELTIACESDLIDVMVLARGSQSEEFFGLGHGRALNLREGWPVRVELPSGVVAAAGEGAEDGTDRFTIAVRFHRSELDPRIARASSIGGRFYAEPPEATFVGSEAEVLLPRLGEYEIEWAAWRTEDFGPLELGDPRVLVLIEEDCYERTFRPEFPLERYQAAIASVR